MQPRIKADFVFPVDSCAAQQLPELCTATNDAETQLFGLSRLRATYAFARLVTREGELDVALDFEILPRRLQHGLAARIGSIGWLGRLERCDGLPRHASPLPQFGLTPSEQRAHCVARCGDAPD